MSAAFAVLMALALVMALTGVASGDTDSSVVTATVPSATSLDATGCSNGANYSTVVNGDSPAARWKLEEPAGATTIADSSGNGNTGTLYGTRTTGAPGLLANDGRAATLTTTSGAFLSDSASLSTPTVSVEAWFKLDSFPTGTFATLAYKGLGYWLRIEPSGSGGTIRFYVHDGTGWEPNAATAVVPRIGRTYHVVGVYDGARSKVYVDGVLAADLARPGAVNDANHNINLGGHDFAGTIDEIAIYPAPLSEAEVLEHYRAGSGTSSIGTVPTVTSARSPDDCTLAFGSSNDTSMLKMYQRDGGGSAMTAGPASADTSAWWPLNDTSQDLSPVGNALTLGTGAFDPAYVDGAPGYGRALEFDGNDFAQSAPSPEYRVTSYTTDLWFKTNDISNTAWPMMMTRVVSSADRAFAIFFNRANNTLGGEVGDGVGWYDFETPAAAYLDNQWHHVAFVVQPTRADLYVDGRWRAGGTLPTPPSVTDAGITIGAFTPGLGQNFLGSIDEPRFQRGVRTAGEIAAYYRGAISNYEGSGDGDDTDWSSSNATTMFGGCLRAKSSAAVTATWNLNGTCPMTDGNYWNPIVATAGTAGAKIASASSGSLSESVSLRFGMRTGTNTAAGTYRAELVTEVVAPNTP